MNRNAAIAGAGLVGTLFSLLLRKRGYDVEVFEKRPAPQNANVGAGRSINLALSHRGLQALRQIGLHQKALDLAVPMKGRMIHDEKGQTHLLPYGQKGEYINSISRAGLNYLLIEEARKQGVVFRFENELTEVALHKSEWQIAEAGGQIRKVSYPVMVGADGAFSQVREAMMKTPRFDYSQSYLAHGYQELSIPATRNGSYAMEPHALHIWPRGQYMLIALPNAGGDFTATLFLPFEGKNSFRELSNPQEARAFFEAHFPDALPLMPDFEQEIQENPVAPLATIRCRPYAQGQTVLIGDAAHAVVPFYGQGMNAGFEDCRLLDQMLDSHDWEEAIRHFAITRKADGDAIADLALQNFIEMRDKVADPWFLRKKNLSLKLSEALGDEWTPLYEMVTFSDLPYSEALQKGHEQDRLLEKLLNEYPETETMDGDSLKGFWLGKAKEIVG